MNNSLLMPIMDTGIIMVEVQFRNSDIYHNPKDSRAKKSFRSNDDPAAWSRNYTYKAHRSLMLQVGGTVMVQARGWFQIARVAAVDVAIPMDDSTTTYKWVVANVNPAIAQLNQTLTNENSVTQALDRKRAEMARVQALDALGLTEQEAALLISK